MNIMIFLIFITFFQIFLSQNIQFPIIIEKSPLNMGISAKEVMNSLETINYYILIKIGNPEQEIKFYLTFNSAEIFICSEKMKYSLYKETKSNTYKVIYNVTKEFSGGKYNEGLLSQDNYYLSTINKILFEEIKFNLATRAIYLSYFPAEIGLSLPNYYTSIDYNLLNQLKKKNLIESNIWSIQSFNDNDVKFIIGQLPHEINKNFNIKNYRTTNTLKYYSNLIWGFEISNILIGKTNIDKNNPKKCKIEMNSRFITLSLKEMNFYKEEFFQKYIDKKICNNSTIHENYFFYCEKSIKIENLPEILFEHKELNYIFNIDYKDLFIHHENKYYFLITFSTLETECKLGEIFIKKFKLVFDQDKKVIGIYTLDNNSKFSKFLIVLLIFIIIILIFLGGIYLGFLLKKKRKIRANELEDEFLYEPKNEK